MNTQQIDQLIDEAQALGAANNWTMREKLHYLVNESTKAEQKRCCGLIFGHCGSDNVAQRTVDAIKRGDK